MTRYVVELDGGGTLVAVRQNLETAAAEVLEAHGRRVSVAWRRTRPTRSGTPRRRRADRRPDNQAGADRQSMQDRDKEEQ